MPRREPIHWIRDPAHIEALASPLRQRILDRLEALGPCSVRELAESLGRRPDALYYHVRMLEDIGLIRETESRPTTRSPEAVYDLAERRWHIAYAPEDRDNAAALRKLTRHLLRQAERDFDEGLESEHATVRGRERNLWSLRLEASLSKSELRELVGHLEAIVAILRKPKRSRRGRLVALSWVLAPIDPSSPKPES